MIHVWLIIGAVAAIGSAIAASSGSSSGSSSDNSAAELAEARRRNRQARLDTLATQTRVEIEQLAELTRVEIGQLAEAMAEYAGRTVLGDNDSHVEQFCQFLGMREEMNSAQMLEALLERIKNDREEAWQAVASDLCAFVASRRQKEHAEVAELEQLMDFWRTKLQQE